MTISSFEEQQPVIHASAFVHATALVLGDVQLGAESSIWPFTVVRGDVNRIYIGERSNIQDNSVLHVTHDGPQKPGGFPLWVGDEVTVGHRVILHGCRIEGHCLIGMGATVMDGAIVPSNTIIGAHSLVPPGKELESGYLWLGSPARKARALSEEELASLEYSAAHYVRLKNRYLVSGK